jgi:hypothetical protein
MRCSFILDIVLLWEKEAVKCMILFDTQNSSEVVRVLNGQHCTDFNYQCTASLHVGVSVDYLSFFNY